MSEVRNDSMETLNEAIEGYAMETFFFMRFSCRRRSSA